MQSSIRSGGQTFLVFEGARQVDGEGECSIMAPLGEGECSIIAPLGDGECSIIASLGDGDDAPDPAAPPQAAASRSAATAKNANRRMCHLLEQ
jgi:hypothetical protein